MKKIVLSLFLSILISISGFTQISKAVKLSSEKTSIEVLQKSSNSLRILNKVAGINAQEKNSEEQNFYKFAVKNYNKNIDNVGKPDLPVLRKFIEIPYGAEVEVNIIGYDLEIINLDDYGITNFVFPVQPSYSKSADPSEIQFQFDEEAYSADVFTKDPLASVEILGIMRGTRIGNLTISPFSYNPVENVLKVYNNLEVELVFTNADIALTKEMKDNSYSPMFDAVYSELLNYEVPASKDAITEYPIKYVIVADPMFETQLQPFIQWKTRKGFNVIEAYTNDAAVGSTTTSIQNYLEGLYNAGTPSDPAPTFVLLVGDVAQVPTFNGVTSSHKTDLYYVEYTGDYFPEVYIGRFSAQTTNQLQPQIDKTLMYEQYTMSDPSYLGNTLLVAGVDVEGGDPNGFSSIHGNGQLQYGIVNYFNAANGISVYEYLYPESDLPASVALIKADFNTGVAYANYTAHCSSVGWANPSFVTSDVPGMTNDEKYGLMVGNCCQSATINDNECFAEAVLRKANGGAVGYIGGSNYSYWDEDYHWGVGASNIQSSPPVAYNASQLGLYDRSFHQNGEAESAWYITNCALMIAGNMAVEQAGDGMKDYYWEIYHMIGDPSIMNYFWEPAPITATYTNPVNVGTTTLNVTTEQYAYVAISQNNVLLDAQYTGAGTSVTLTFSAFTIPGTADVVVTKQNRSPYIGTLTIINASTPPIADFVADQTVVTAGTTINFTDLSADYPATWAWDFGGGATNSTVQNPSVPFNTPGTYTVSLYVTNGAGNDTETKVGYITVNPITTPPVVDFVGTPTTLIVGGTVDFTDLSTNMPDTWAWTFDGGTPGTSTVQNPTGIQYDTPGTYDVTLVAENTVGPATETKVGYIVVSPCTLCPSIGDMTYQTSTTLVDFNTINNTSGKTDYSDYTSQSTDIIMGSSYDLTVNVNTDGNYIVHSFAWIDWNHDCDFDDAGEEYDLGDATNTTNGPTSNIPLNITVPGTALYGATTMRVSTKYNGDPTSCETNYDGEVEDYTVVVISTTNPPIADFSADVTSTCIGIVNFTDASSGIVDSWDWDFGDGNSSTDQNPSHTYTTNGTYSVEMTATNIYGDDTHTETNYITVDLPAAPTVADGDRCGTGVVSLTASGAGTLNWYDAASAGTLVNTGASFVTPSITSTTTYYVEDVFVADQYIVGNSDINSNGGNFNNNQYQIFTAFTDLTIFSVDVNASTTGNRTFELQNSTGTVLESAVINVPIGMSTVILNFAVPTGVDYRLAINTTSTKNLWRNNVGVSYPYEEAGVISITNSSAGTGFYYFFYDWVVKVGDDCVSARTPVVATINAPATLAMSSTDESTPGANNGTATVTPTGTPAYTYIWTGGQTTATATGLTEGNYCVTVTDGNGCQASDCVDVAVGASTLSASSVVVSNATCFGICNGTATVTPTGGSGTYTYIWDNSETTATAIALCSGTHTVTVSDGSTTTSSGVTITQPTALIATTTSTNVTCNGASTGSATASASGGVGSYTYLWSTGGTTASVTGLIAGSYTVTVTDGNGCVDSESVTITQPTALFASTTGTDAICYGASTGSAIAIGGGGTGSYSYLWSTGGTSGTETGLASGIYSVVVTDGNGCTTSEPVTISEPSQITYTSSTIDASCGNSDGSATLSVSGGTGSYSYLWSSGGTASTETNLSSGSYSCEITDVNGCLVTAIVGISDSDGPTASIASSTNPLCNGASTGSASVSATGGTSPYTFLWSTGSSSPSVSGLPAGTYTVEVIDQNNCSDTETVTISEPSAITYITNTNDATCGNTDGWASVTASGGTGSYSYLWSSGGNASTETALGAGIYICEITDANGCLVSASATINSLDGPTASVSGSDANCYGGNDGTASVTVSGGTAPFTYSWSSGGNAVTESGLTAGVYSVIVTDFNGCFTTEFVTISEPSQITFTTNNGDASCGNSDGWASVNAAGGTGSFTYLWSSGGTASTETLLAAGTYTCQITDGNGCDEIASVIVGNSDGPLVYTSVNDATCYGGNNGAAVATATGGSGSYTYLWSTGATSSILTGLVAGTYTVSVEDGNGCIASETVTVNEPLQITYTSETGDANCGNNDGWASLTATGGTGSYSYLWSSGGNASSEIALTAGTYTCEITDVNGCLEIASVTINSIGGATVMVTGSDATCFDGNNGVVAATAIGGTSPYSYIWSSGSTTSIVTGLTAGTYSVTVTDFAGCASTETIVIGEGIEIVVTMTSDIAQASVTASGGVSPYSYLWSNDETTETITGLENGTYYVTVTDANGCSVVDSIDVLGDQLVENKNSYFTIFPNPTSGLLNIEFTNMQASNIIIVDMIGKQVYHSDDNSTVVKLDISFLDQGVYFVKFNSGESTITRKIVLTK